MERYLRENFAVEPKRTSEEALRRWRSAVSVVKNPRRRFRMVADLAKRAESQRRRNNIQEKFRVAFYVQKAAFHFIDAGKRVEYRLTEEVREAGFGIDPDDLAVIARNHDSGGLDIHGGVEGIAMKLSVSLNDGVITSDVPTRQNTFGFNKYVEKPSKAFWMFVWEALQDLTLMILMVCAAVSTGVGIATEGWPTGMYDGIGIILGIILVVMVTAISDYKQSLQFKELDKEKKKIVVQVNRDGCRQKVSIFDLVVGDVVLLSIGDQVPADGIFMSGYSLSIDESSLTGESEPVNVDHKWPFLLSGTKVQDGSGKMLVTSVGMKTEWGKLMETLNEEGEDETPLQVKLNGVATIIGMIGLGFAVLTFVVLTGQFLVHKAVDNKLTDWTWSDATILLNYFATAVTIVVVAVPEGLPLAVTLSLAFAMKQLMRDKALVRHLSACDTMGSSTCICTDKTGTLTTNHMRVHKVWICEETKYLDNQNSKEVLKSSFSGTLMGILLQSIFLNTGSEVVIRKDGESEILGTPTETAILEFGLLLGNESSDLHQGLNIVKVEPFNSVKKKMSVLVSLPTGGFRAFCKGASEVILTMCDNIVNSDGESVPLYPEKRKNVSDVINGFAGEGLRTLCLAFRDSEDDSTVDTIPDDCYTLIAVIGIKDPVRPGVRDAVKTCLAAGITVRMVTGDNIHTAKAIARECGILTVDGLAIEGPDFRNKSSQEMTALIPKLQVMARSLPLDKHTLVNQLRKVSKEVVAVTGDGTNDAPALHEADIGLAMGIAGTEVAKENADVVIMDDNFTTIVNVAKWGRAVYINIQKFVQFQLTVNVVALVLNFVSACISGSAPLTAIQLLWVNMIMDTLGALALATEPPNDGLMKRPPVGRSDTFITRVMWRNIIGQSIYQLAILLLLEFDGERVLMLPAGSDAGSILNTFIFNCFVFCQVFNEINSRDMEKINVLRGILDGWIFMVVVVSTVAFQVVMVEFLGAFADTVPLSWQLWLASVLIGAVSLPVGAVLKCIPVQSAKHATTAMHHDGYEHLPSGPDLA